MHFWAPFATLFLSLLLTPRSSAQFFDRHGRIGSQGVLSGTVRNSDGSAAAGITVEVRPWPSGAAVASTTTASNGSFEIYNIPSGLYEVVANSDKAEDVRENVTVGFAEATVDLRFTQPADSSAGSMNSVSVAQMKVPNKARDAYRKAQQAFDKGNLVEPEIRR